MARIVKIDPIMQEKYAEVIIDIIEESKRNNQVNAVYLLSYCHPSDFSKNATNIYIAMDSKDYSRYISDDEKFLSESLLKKIEQLSSDYKNFPVFINYVSSRNHDFIEKQREVRECKDIVNSHILYDKTGYYKKVQNRKINGRPEFLKMLSKFYSNLIEFEPPLYEEVEKRLTKKS